MRKDLLPQVPFYKAALHAHSTVSDGKQTPEDVKQTHKEHGYQILCITDHNIINCYNHLNEPDFLMLTGMEINTNQRDGWYLFNDPTYHLLFIAKDPNNLWQPIPRWREQENKEAFAQSEDMDISYNMDAVNAMIAQGNEKGFLCCYAHPSWSQQSYPDYAPLEGLWAMELCNSGCNFAYDRYNNRIYRDMCTLGKKLVPLGSDDSHAAPHIGLAWTMIGAPELTYPSVIAAMEKGDLYMSTGPQIHSLYIEDEYLHITCSAAKNILISSGSRWSLVIQNEDGSPITEAKVKLTSWLEKSENIGNNAFIWLTVTAYDGNYAATRAYTREELIF